jgi:TRAP-type C4-dicarboxylate transport system substrate-binding protein
MGACSRVIAAVMMSLAPAMFMAHAHAATDVDVATAYAADNFQTRNLQQFANEIRSATEGRVNLRIHPGGKLLKPGQIYQGVREGKAGAGEVIMSSLEKEAALFGIDSLPFIVSGYDDAKRLWEASRAAVATLLEAQGLKLLYAVPWPPQNLYAIDEVNTIRDFTGRSMRVYTPTTERIAQLLGARPVTFQVIDLGKAIAAKRIELMLTSSWTGVDTHAWSSMKYYYKVNAWLPKNMVFISKAIFDGLSPSDRKLLLDAARTAETRGWQMSQESDAEYEKQLKANGIKVAGLDFMIRNHLDRIGETVAREWLKKAGVNEMKVLLKYTVERSAR